MTSVLVIKLGAFEDMVQATPMFHALYQHYGDNLTLLTRRSYVDFASRLYYFKQIIDDKNSLFDDNLSIKEAVKMLWKIRKQNFDIIIDLQNTVQTRIYQKTLFGSYKQWITPVIKTLDPDIPPFFQALGRILIKLFNIDEEKEIHPFKRFSNLCQHYKWQSPLPPKLKKLAQPLGMKIELPYTIIVAASFDTYDSTQEWPQKNFAKLCDALLSKGITPMLVGSESDYLDELVASCPKAINLIGKLNIYQLISLGMNATASIGNNTGRQLIIAASGCPTITLFNESNPPKKGGAWAWDEDRHLNIYYDDLNDLSVNYVLKVFEQIG